MNPNIPLTLVEAETTPVWIPILLLLGGLGALFIGMSMLQSATEKLATGGLKKLFEKTASSKLAGVGIGTLSTMIMQSSGATTVMVVGFVNAGVMTLAQAATYIMGANIGTTITAQIVALGGLSSSSFPLTETIIALTLAGTLIKMTFKKKHPKIALAGDLLAGLGLLFLGLETMTSNLQILFLSNESFKSFLTSLTNPFLLLFLGIILTVLSQSSSAVTSIVLAMAMAGAVIGGSGNGVLYLILGSNIGSCSTALLSSIGATANGKRTAMIHLLFNVLGSLIFFVVLLCWPSAMELTLAKLFPDNPSLQIAMFHTFFNLLCTILFLPFVNVFVKLSKFMVKDKKGSVESDLLDPRFLSTPELALSQALSFYHLLANQSLSLLDISLDAFLDKDETKAEEINASKEKIAKMAKELSTFLVSVGDKGLAPSSSGKISRMQLDIADILRLEEVAENIVGYTRHEVSDELTFSSVVKDDLCRMKKMLEEMFSLVSKTLDKPDLQNLRLIHRKEDEIDALRSGMIAGHLERLEQGKCKPQSSNVFINLVGNLERCGDHLNFIAERNCSHLLPEEEREKEILRP